MREYILKRSKRRRRSVSLQVNADKTVTARAPYRMPKILVDQFVKKSENWILKRLGELDKKPVKKKKHFKSHDELHRYIETQLNKYKAILNLHPSRVRFSKVKSYWGSCSPSNVLSFNDHLIYAPPSAVEYVVVHELCHIRWRGHGKRFWDLVNKTFEDANEMRKVLRQISRGNT